MWSCAIWQLAPNNFLSMSTCCLWSSIRVFPVSPGMNEPRNTLIHRLLLTQNDGFDVVRIWWHWEWHFSGFQWIHRRATTASGTVIWLTSETAWDASDVSDGEGLTAEYNLLVRRMLSSSRSPVKEKHKQDNLPAYKPQANRKSWWIKKQVFSSYALLTLIRQRAITTYLRSIPCSCFTWFGWAGANFILEAKPRICQMGGYWMSSALTLTFWTTLENGL